jgi:predicted molibdopterin-dependent oxidoreductase YjgC
VSADWDAALRAAAGVLGHGRVVVLASPMLSNEALYLLGRLAERAGGAGVFRVERGPEAPLPGVEDLALRAERAANVRGAELLGFTERELPLDELREGDVLLIADEELRGHDAAALSAAASRVAAVVVLGTTLPAWAAGAATVVLPITNFAEEEGTFTNVRGRVQRFLQARAAPGLARPSWYVLTDLVAALGDRANYLLPAEVFAAMAESRPEFAGLSYDALGLRGSAANVEQLAEAAS